MISELSLGLVHFVSLDNCVMTRTHHHVQNNLTALKIACAPSRCCLMLGRQGQVALGRVQGGSFLFNWNKKSVCTLASLR